MKLSKLYSNKPDLFEPILFNGGLNVVYAEIRLPENRNKDTHNLGKSTLGRLIDFTLLSKRHPEFFLFKRSDVFTGFIFYLEIEITENSFVTVCRGVDKSTKINFKSHSEEKQDFTNLGESEWDHYGLAFERAVSLLDGLLDLTNLKPWNYRKGLGYLVRTQEDYLDIFKLRKFGGADAHWKPYLAQILGFNSEIIKRHYEKESEIESKETIISTVSSELVGFDLDLGKVEGVLQIKQHEAGLKRELLDSFDFKAQDENKTEILVNDIDEEISDLNSRRYSLYQSRKKIINSLQSDQIIFDPELAKNIFSEVGVLFDGQIKKDFEELIQFNRSITDERIAYLKEEKGEIDADIKKVNERLSSLNETRTKTLEYLGETEVFNRYKLVSNELVSLMSDIETLKRQKKQLQRLSELRADVKTLKDAKSLLQSEIEADVLKENADEVSTFSKIRLNFRGIVHEVINRDALLSVAVNGAGHLQFKVDILSETGQSTSADAGHTYKKLLCIAFDLAILKEYSGKKFPHFVFHDGVFESLDDRKKKNLLNVIKKYIGYGVQSTITLIDSDLPASINGAPIFDEQEIILDLHDEGAGGRIFKIPSW